MTGRLLVLASAVEPAQISKREAETLLLGATKRIGPSVWVGVLGRFLLGQTEFNEMKAHRIGNIDRGVKGVLPHRIWLTDFYDAARQLNRSEIDALAFRSLMRSLADVVESDSTDTHTFAKILRNPEFFFARAEAAKCG